MSRKPNKTKQNVSIVYSFFSADSPDLTGGLPLAFGFTPCIGKMQTVHANCPISNFKFEFVLINICGLPVPHCPTKWETFHADIPLHLTIPTDRLCCGHATPLDHNKCYVRFSNEHPASNLILTASSVVCGHPAPLGRISSQTLLRVARFT